MNDALTQLQSFAMSVASDWSHLQTIGEALAQLSPQGRALVAQMLAQPAPRDVPKPARSCLPGGRPLSADGTTVRERAIAALHAEPMRQADLARAVGATPGAVAVAMKVARDNGQVTRLDDGRYALVSQEAAQ